MMNSRRPIATDRLRFLGAGSKRVEQIVQYREVRIERCTIEDVAMNEFFAEVPERCPDFRLSRREASPDCLAKRLCDFVPCERAFNRQPDEPV